MRKVFILSHIKRVVLRLQDFFRLIRIEQWYKNIVIFIPLVFSFNLFHSQLFFLTFIGFLALCLVSSSFYIINDLVDLKKDKLHPEKKLRPLAAGKIKASYALILSVILFLVSVLIAYSLSATFLYAVLALFVISQVYNFYVRNIAFLDLIIISINFVIRAASGVFIIEVPLTPWVILSTFFLSMFLVSTKRFTELSTKGLKNYRPGFDESDKKPLEFLMGFSIVCVFVFFSIYSILSNRESLLLSLPIALYITTIFFHNSYSHPEKVRNPERFIFDRKILLALILWLFVVILTFYGII